MKYWAWLLLSVTTLLVLTTTALAHSYLSGSSPKAGQTVRVMPKTIKLEFSQALELGFSSFKVYPLPASSDPQKTAIDLSQKVLALKNDGEARADLGLVSDASPAAKLELKLKEKLLSGWYVVMYRILSVDSHITSGQFIFQFQP